METLSFDIKIYASPQRVWDILWTKETYQDWTKFFSCSSTMQSDWTVGGQTRFFDGEGNGMISTIESIDQHKEIVFKHLGMIQNGKEDFDSEEVKSWAGSLEKYLLFDLDGTLIDSEYFYYSNWSPILQREFEINISFEDWIKDFAGHTLVRNVQFLRERYKVETDEESMWNKTRAAYAQSDMTSIRLMPHVKEVLESLQK